MTTEKIRLSKIMAARGLCSRRKADALIQQGLVCVDGKIIRTLGSKIFLQQKITLLPAAHTQLRQAVTILLHKPIGFVSGQPEQGYPPAAALITPQNHYWADHSGIAFSPAHHHGLAPAGRLDIDSQGLLVLTQDGRIARQLIGQNSQVEKEYLVRIEGTLSSPVLAQLHYGLQLDGRFLKPAQVKQLRPQVLQLVLVEGRKRQIRRMCQLVGLKVKALKRVRIGAVRLGGLPLGKWRYLKPDEHF